MMIKMHRYVNAKAQLLLRSHVSVYIWNDSIMSIAYFVGKEDKKRILREQSALKEAIDERVPERYRPYIILVQGKIFPVRVGTRKTRRFPVVVILKTSSWAMANCFEIEKTLGHTKSTWYIDGRILKGLALANNIRKRKVKLFPSMERRNVVMVRDATLRLAGHQENSRADTKYG